LGVLLSSEVVLPNTFSIQPILLYNKDEQASTLRDALGAGIALEGFPRQCHVLSLANPQIINVLQAVVMIGSQSS
jgi:hypothetical protein